MSLDHARIVRECVWIGIAWLVIGLPILAWAERSEASVTATATRTADPSVVRVKVRVALTVKRPLERRVFAYTCQDDGVRACLEEPVYRRIHLHKGRNRLSFAMRVQALMPGLGPVPEGWDGNPATRSFSLPRESADVVFYWFGQATTYQQVKPKPVAQESLVDVGA